MNEDRSIALVRDYAAEAPAVLSAGSGLVRPLGTPQDAVDAWRAFEQVKLALLHDDDYQSIQGRRFTKKSGWRKIAAAFGISTQLVREVRRVDDDGVVVEVVMRAIAPNGRFAEGVGSCASDERRFSHPEHDMRATAATRATNRAISDLVGGGEVSAEEVDGESHRAPPRTNSARGSWSTNKPAQSSAPRDTPKALTGQVIDATPVPDAEAAPEWICQEPDCGAHLEPVKDRGGHEVPIEKFAAESRRQFGKELCATHYTAAVTAKAQPTKPLPPSNAAQDARQKLGLPEDELPPPLGPGRPVPKPSGGPLIDGVQLSLIQNHIRRTGTTASAICATNHVQYLEELSHQDAAEVLADLTGRKDAVPAAPQPVA